MSPSCLSLPTSSRKSRDQGTGIRDQYSRLLADLGHWPRILELRLPIWSAFSMPVTTEVRVRYAETDQMGIVYYANYLVWFEIGRVELLRSLGLAYSQLESDHQCILPVIEATCRYKSPARYDDQILIETRPSLLRQSVVKFAYRIL